MKDENLHPDIEERLLDYLLGEADEEDRQAVERWRREEPAHEEAYRRMRRDLLLIRWGAREERLDAEGRKRALLRRLRAHRSRQLHRVQWAAAVVALFLVGGAVYWLWPSRQDEQPLAKASQVIKPGSPRATLILSTGEQIDLTRTTGDSIREEDGSLLTVNENRQITYDTTAQTVEEQPIYNKIVVPRGGEFELVLADGTRVWMNSDSKLIYPVTFRGATREVRMEGEVCFSVARNERQPFVVHAGDAAVRVLGTFFNVEAYPDEEEMTTTLVEGRVSVSVGKDAEVLTPNQQAVVREKGGIEVRTVDAKAVVSWVRGVCYFSETSLEEIMDKLARWYNVEVFFADASAKAAHFSLEIERYEDVSTILSKIEKTGRVRFEVNGRTVIVRE